MALDVVDLFDWLSSAKKWTWAILSKLETELSPEWYSFYVTWSSRFKSETDVVVALWRWEEGILTFFSELSPQVQEMIHDFTVKRVEHVIQLKVVKDTRNDRDSL